MVKQINIAYGTGQLNLNLPEKYKILESTAEERGKIDWQQKIKASFSNPVDSPTLASLVQQEKPEKIVIIINDITRPVPYNIVLKPMLEELEEAGIVDENISLLIATGMHRPMTPKEVEETVGKDIIDRYHWENHKCEEEMVYAGKLSEGIPLYVNPLAMEADLLCAIGVIAPHYMAGYSGGRKSLLPGVCGRETIETHHSLMRLPEAKTANLAGNKFHQTAVEAAKMANLKFISNVIVDSKNEPVDLVVGHYLKAWEKGVELCRKNSVIKIDKLADAVIVSTGGFPKDINMYQAQKALENASYCVKEGAPILLIAECKESLGEDTFEKWLLEAEKPEYLEEKIKKVFELGGHKAFAIARVARKNPLYLYSSMKRGIVQETFMDPVKDINEFVSQLISAEDLVYIIPHGANTVPLYTD
ncbi:nickel-dependent lactate racemase [Halocella sp. SP3-1]|uniref:nickel-dependent lactate racemase n=1 Tax=Halocella sp. SP3-1 TaxID=2382161 RepID=UPI000F74E2F5|nr:nickel-dependent lactate racemase [Halocella sp. SP3-1]AZO93343.1 nickel-dependent lactate racemase [Halocella sp. SP3-1]